MQSFSNLFTSVRRSTCFRRFFRPSLGAQNCTYSVRHLSDRYRYLLLAVRQAAVMVWQMPDAICAVLCSWRWTKKPSETCRASCRKNSFEKLCILLVVLREYITTNCVCISYFVCGMPSRFLERKNNWQKWDSSFLKVGYYSHTGPTCIKIKLSVTFSTQPKNRKNRNQTSSVTPKQGDECTKYSDSAIRLRTWHEKLCGSQKHLHNITHNRFNKTEA